MSISVITGKIRSGKTSFMTAKAIINALDMSKTAERYKSVYNLSKQGFNVSWAKYALYSNYQIDFKERDVSLKSINVDPRKLLIGKNATFLRPFSTLAIAEAQTYFNARAFQNFTPEQARFFQTSGHFGIDIYLDTQDIDTLDKVLRGLCDVYHITGRHIYDNNGKEVDYAEPRNVSRITFSYDYYTDVTARPRHETLTIPFNVFEAYNPFNHYYEYLPQDKKKGTII